MGLIYAHFATLVFVLGLGLAFFLCQWRYPKILVVLWLLMIGFVPWWTGVAFHTFFPVATLASILVVLCLQPILLERVSPADVLLAGFFVFAIVPALTGLATRTQVFEVAAIWAPAYLVGRLLPQRVAPEWLYGAVACCFAIVSMLAIVEFIFNWNPFVGLRLAAGPTYDLWAPVQYRGGELRVEGAFGHSIALGSSIALAIPMTLASRFSAGLRVIFTGLMVVATTLTFSRTAMVCAALGVAFSVLFAREVLSVRMRAAVSGSALFVGVVLIPLASSTFGAAGGEAARSASYRAQLTSLIPSMRLLGLARSAQQLGDGSLVFGRFQSIDSELILVGLTYGLVVLGFALLLLLVAGALVVGGHGRPAMIAVAAQIPSLITVALITQYAVFFWFGVGLAVATQFAPSRARASGGELEPASGMIHVKERGASNASIRGLTGI